MAKPDITKQEVIRSSFSCDGTRLYLVYDTRSATYRLATRWQWLAAFDSIWDACDAFEALELLTGCERQLAGLIKREIKRVPRHSFGSARNTIGRLNYLINSVERRLQGQRPIRCGSKGSVERWIAA
jgi:hypothetical protein